MYVCAYIHMYVCDFSGASFLAASGHIFPVIIRGFQSFVNQTHSVVVSIDQALDFVQKALSHTPLCSPHSHQPGNDYYCYGAEDHSSTNWVPARCRPCRYNRWQNSLHCIWLLHSCMNLSFSSFLNAVHPFNSQLQMNDQFRDFQDQQHVCRCYDIILCVFRVYVGAHAYQALAFMSISTYLRWLHDIRYLILVTSDAKYFSCSVYNV